ncbi:CYTH-like domain-containing protein [Lobosporangium transversale]|uniref:CYTH-like domain-containing protein n=1 Tax=Lobosporangium transversale TaxID=64571 RepID=A0A1Y2GED4_9FUNG|nr:CYTH-like domain-containing protein [Lobosporangium transversale]ORZ08517.1 CYTH-like domain-containing protein [Lobosporangium transversale]|eukprot:XP_021878445.1 CYTH-like domain-containing protein [Lobosporangium transversale]
MEIEIKIRLPSEDATCMLEKTLGSPIASEDQNNVFFDGVHKELIKSRLVFRIRIIQKSDKVPVAVVALKGNAVLVNGIATVEEEEEPIDIAIARQIIDNPNLIPEAAKSHRLLQKIVERVPCPDGYSHMGRFKNIRHKFQWREYLVEVDRTTYPHGTAYEVEIESTEPEKAKESMTSLLDEHGISYGYSQRNKFENMFYGTLL